MNEREPLYHAKRELSLAEKAIKRMNEAETFEDLEDEWKIFLGAIEKVWVKTERACQPMRNKFQPWQGTFGRERKKDPLLKYVKHARNSDSHSIQETMSTQSASSSMYIEGGSGGTYIDNLEIRGGKLVNYKGNKPLIIENLPNRVELLRIKDGNKWYNPPKTHKDIRLVWPAPLNVATLALNYYADYVNQAELKFFTNNT